MKSLKNIIASVAAVFAVASCTIVPDDTFSTAPVAPIMSSHNDILITTATVEEDVTFTWDKARFIDAEAYVYDLSVKFGEEEAVLAAGVTETFYTLGKAEFRTFLKENFSLEQNSTHSLSAYVSLKDDAGTVYASEPVAFKVYVYDDAVPSVATADSETLVLDKNNPGGEIALLSWTDPRLVYGEDVTYTVVLKVGEGEEVVLAYGLYDMSYATTVDALNEAVIAAGGAEDTAVEATLIVYACCPSIPEGVPSNEVNVTVTTYVATFSEQYYMPGSYQGWNPATAHVLPVSKTTKGLYQGFVDLTTADGADVEFKFSPVPEWNGDFGFSDVKVEPFAGKYAHAYASTTASDNIKVPSGFYYVKLNKKFNTLEMVQVENLEIIGDFNSWGSGIAMTWDSAAKTWTVPENIKFTNGTGFKFRFNSDWTYSFGGALDNVQFGGDNIPFTKNDGTYMVILNTASADFTVNAVDVNMPDYLVVAGDYSGHSWSATDDMRVNLYDSSKGLYRGYITMYGATYGFKFVKNGSVWNGQTATSGYNYTLADGGGDNCMIADGTYFWTFDIINMTATALPITKVGIIGDFNGWGSDAEMTFDSTALTYTIEQTFESAGGFKFRFNGDWGYNLGGDLANLAHDGANISIEPGTYVITLDMAHGSVPSCTITAK